MDDVQMLLAREAIKELKSRYFRATDAHDYELFGSLFTEDAVFESGQYGEPLTGKMSGRAAIVAGTKAASGDAIKIHHGHNGEISFPAPGRAEGIWAAEYRFFERQSRRQIRHDFCHYYEDYVLQDGRWRIARLRLVLVHSLV